MHQSFYLHSGVKFSDKKEIINKRNGWYSGISDSSWF
jgi:hypothetical protein